MYASRTLCATASSGRLIPERDEGLVVDEPYHEGGSTSEVCHRIYFRGCHHASLVLQSLGRVRVRVLRLFEGE